MPTNRKHTWQIIGKSVRGAAHVRRQRPNQDAIAWWPRGGLGPPLALAVADGHGNPCHLRSQVGAKLAVQVAGTVLHELWQEQGNSASLSAVKRTAEERLPQVIVRAWTDAIHQHLTRRPIRDAEWQDLERRADLQARISIEDDPRIAYGTTLIATLLTERFILYLQIGDGDILVVSDHGDVGRPPLSVDARLLGNQTTSLCSPDAWREFRLYFQPIANRPPALILLATDGYANSYADDAGFQSVGRDLYAAIGADGLAHTCRQLGHWLRTTSAAGSGDDITAGLLWRQTTS